MNHPSSLPRRNLLKSLAATVALPLVTSAHANLMVEGVSIKQLSEADTPCEWTITDPLGQRLLLEVFNAPPSDEQARGRPTWPDRTGGAWLVLSDVPSKA